MLSTTKTFGRRNSVTSWKPEKIARSVVLFRPRGSRSVREHCTQLRAVCNITEVTFYTWCELTESVIWHNALHLFDSSIHTVLLPLHLHSPCTLYTTSNTWKHLHVLLLRILKHTWTLTRECAQPGPAPQSLYIHSSSSSKGWDWSQIELLTFRDCYIIMYV